MTLSARLLIGILFFGISAQTFAQQNQIIHLENNVYQYVKLLQQRGHLSELNPTKLPYTRGAIMKALRSIESVELSKAEQFWFNFIVNELGYDDTAHEDNFYLYGMLEGGFDLNNSLNEDGIRPQDHKLFFLPNGASNLYSERGPFAGQLELRHALIYDQERLGENALSR